MDTDMTPTPAPAVLPPLPDTPWRELFWQMAKKLGCLPSTFPDANDHVFRAADRYIGLACKTCSGHGLVGHMTAEGGEGWECPDCHGTGAIPAQQEGQKHLAACDGWQPIETAPMYTPVRIYAQGGGFHNEDFNPSGSVEGFLSDDGNWCGAFWNAEQDDWDRRDGIVPTHWMPLPAAPTGEGA